MATARSHDDEPEAGGPHASQRLDKWLWFVRVVKSRTQAAALVTEGKVRINRERTTKPAQSLRPGDVVTITVRGRIRILRMLAAGERRGPASDAAQLFEDLTPPPPPKAEPNLAAGPERDAGSGRPTKRDRRKLDRLTNR